MNTLKLQTGPAKDRFVTDSFLLAEFEFSETEMIVSLGPDGTTRIRHVSTLWSHTIFELENLAMGLLYIGRELPEFYEVPSRDTLIGPTVHLRSALWWEIGRPGLNYGGPCLDIHAMKISRRLGQRVIVPIEITYDQHVVRANFEVEDLAPFAEALYAQAKKLEPQFLANENLDDDSL